MKPHTRNVLDACTDLLVDAHMERIRRGLAIWQLNQEMWGAIWLQHRDFADGTVMIDTCPQLFWKPVQKIYSLGKGEKYSAFQLPTRSRLWSFVNLGEPDLRFTPGVPPAAELERLRGLIKQHVIPKVLDFADEASILNFYRGEVTKGGGRPELFMALSAWKSRSVPLDKEFEWVVSVLSHQQFIDSVTEFYRRLRNATEVSPILRG